MLSNCSFYIAKVLIIFIKSNYYHQFCPSTPAFSVKMIIQSVPSHPLLYNNFKKSLKLIKTYIAMFLCKHSSLRQKNANFVAQFATLQIDICRIK